MTEGRSYEIPHPTTKVLSATEAVMETIQRVYGDATQTILDRRAADAIIHALRQAGWASLSDVGMLIQAAGGTITVPDHILMETRIRTVYRQEDFKTGGIKFTVNLEETGN